ncbi:MAG: HutD family protein [Limnohabitans sp.]|nr:HutD family protein [Limnohabitans sp.]
MTLHRFDVQALPAMPWKNGGGVTREIVCLPPGAGMNDFDWRVSIAHIASSGPFSAFPGVDRVITLLSGGGVHLLSDDAQVDHQLDKPLTPFAFAGEASIHARLLAGDCHDFNVMTRRNACSATLQVLRSACDWPATSQGLLIAVQGGWQLEGASPQTLAPQQGLWWSDVAMAWQMRPQSPDAALLALTLQFH